MVKEEGVFLTVIDLTGGAVILQVTVMVSLDLFPAACLAVTVIVLLPETREMPVIDHDVVPEAVPEVLLAEFVQVIDVTPTLSEAVPEMLMVD